MPISRRALLGAAAVLLGTTACSAEADNRITGRPVQPEPVDPDDPAGPLFERLRSAPESWSLYLDDGRGTVVKHRATTVRPIAAAGAVVPLAAYARAVAAGFPADAPVPVAEWDRWYVPGTDRDAHRNALTALGAGPQSSVDWDDVVRALTAHGDPAAADLLRETLGDDPLTEAAAAGGLPGHDLPCHAGETLLATRGRVPDPATRRADALAAGRAYASSPEQRSAVAAAARAAASAVPGDREFWAGSPGGTARGLASLHRACAADDLGVPGAGAVARRHLEGARPARLPAGVAAVGITDGDLPGVCSTALATRNDDGTVASAALVLTGLDEPTRQDFRDSGVVTFAAFRGTFSEQVRDRLAGVALG
ncbi:hypothetical protein Ae168Ps1_3931 [Pseudonocardia sp. Ae168_Ps1]|uniref:hypothetical protein n=1 Tax=unclassified Pseudonocardia TaxID=2619320 RepID=UPI00094B59AE|nr:MULTISPECIES: hypothetical protein [unclassified Pseudonocardia]OLL75530.1 hypothetical protein Ae150APs1_3908 [Pseudonocardia sp. Ae150A_Ps1]OLL81525.1 hypothetical protein Ae168Ps1_3931 [Pseudonocardia sp. Ae168_Ps1]OLL84362.1 hypothetical protein Ae263Ps1_1417c [Pseudonocardia sp. Ae263_Ps1]OLL95620.1 hypothetical protein Ae356Ps1_5517 [Pseudonocardia sp. Ae356_Ps1]